MSSKKKMYLKPNVIPEPLVDNWYAWSHLVSPATACFNILNRHIKIMDSYIENPEVHQMACNDPRMLGGPFMDYPEESVEKVKKLKARTLGENSDLIEFAEAVFEMNKFVKENGKGSNIEPLYQDLPSILRGYVELTYDLNHQPRFRFFEALLYRSRFYKESIQSIDLYLTEEDDRPFVLSTPRLMDEPDRVRLNLPFKSKAIDELFKMQFTPGYVEDAIEMLNIPEHKQELFRSFFHETPPRRHEKYEGDGIRTRYFGHACILAEMDGVSILTDPVISYYGYEYDVSRFTYADLPEKIDYVLITHNHQDHILLETMLQIRHKIGTIVVPKSNGGSLQDPSLKLMFNAIGFDNVIEIDEMESIQNKGCNITCLPFIGEHADLDIRSKGCYHVTYGGRKIIFFADSCNVEPELYRHIHEHTGDVDVIFVGMECDGAPLSWLYGPLLMQPIKREADYSRRLKGSNYENAIDLVNRFNPSSVYVYAMGQEPWLKYIMSLVYTEKSNPIIASNQLISECTEREIEAERLFGEKEILYERDEVREPAGELAAEAIG
jgi:L-ascorbate metabolism protein UlaG (beta-lactamase superfamily)